MASLVGLALAGTMVISSCDKDDDDIKTPKNKYTLSGNASGDQEVPAVTTSAAATLTGTYDKESRELTYTINWTGLSGDVTAAHFHGPAAAGETASPLQDITIGTNGMDGSASATISASDALNSALLDGKVYYNLHTAANPDGEIRGHVTLTQQ